MLLDEGFTDRHAVGLTVHRRIADQHRLRRLRATHEEQPIRALRRRCVPLRRGHDVHRVHPRLVRSAVPTGNQGQAATGIEWEFEPYERSYADDDSGLVAEA